MRSIAFASITASQVTGHDHREVPDDHARAPLPVQTRPQCQPEMRRGQQAEDRARALVNPFTNGYRC
jgi:hypothetical protein